MIEKENRGMTKVAERREEKWTVKMRRQGKQNGKGNKGTAKMVVKKAEKRQKKGREIAHDQV
mgnify:CR=1 FL=1